MNTIDEIWDTLFGREMTETERRIMENIAQVCNGEESIIIESAVIVHCLYSTLILDPNSVSHISSIVFTASSE